MISFFKMIFYDDNVSQLAKRIFYLFVFFSCHNKNKSDNCFDILISWLVYKLLDFFQVSLKFILTAIPYKIYIKCPLDSTKNDPDEI